MEINDGSGFTSKLKHHDLTSLNVELDAAMNLTNYAIPAAAGLLVMFVCTGAANAASCAEIEASARTAVTDLTAPFVNSTRTDAKPSTPAYLEAIAPFKAEAERKFDQARQARLAYLELARLGCDGWSDTRAERAIGHLEYVVGGICQPLSRIGIDCDAMTILDPQATPDVDSDSEGTPEDDSES